MKKFFPIIIGIVTGIILSAVMIVDDNKMVAYGEVNWWSSIIAGDNAVGSTIDEYTPDWSDIFSPYNVALKRGQHLYIFMYMKLNYFPEKDALKEIAKKYGITQNEAQQVLDGSVSPLLNNAEKRSPGFSQRDALALMQKAQEDFKDAKELFDMQQELDVEVMGSELFANGDLSDSGFDLITDLENIEQILFSETTATSIGGTYAGELDSPIINNTTNDGPNVNSAVSLTKLSFKEDSGSGGGNKGNTGAKVSNGKVPAGIASKDVGNNNKTDVEVLDEDVCVETDVESNNISNALANYNDKAGGAESGSVSDNSSQNNSSSGSGGSAHPGSNGGGSQKPPIPPPVDANGNVNPAPPDDWLVQWCASLFDEKDEEIKKEKSLKTVFGDAGFTSLGGTTNSVLDKFTKSDPSKYEKAGITVEASICFDVEFIKQTFSTFQPGDSCILCEIQKINELMGKTLSHSLVPNKVAGNFGETAKCKSSYQTNTLDLKFIAIPQPIPTPQNDEIVFNKNIFAEWKKFTDEFQPLLFKELAIDKITEMETARADENTTPITLLNSINSNVAQYTGEALEKVENMRQANDGTNQKLFIQTIAGELQRMRMLFENYKKMYEDTNKICNDLGKKPDTK